MIRFLMDGVCGLENGLEMGKNGGEEISKEIVLVIKVRIKGVWIGVGVVRMEISR